MGLESSCFLFHLEVMRQQCAVDVPAYLMPADAAASAAAPSPILLLLALLQSSPPLGLLLLLVFDSGGRNACTFLE